jgi:hypothetical protein
MRVVRFLFRVEGTESGRHAQEDFHAIIVGEFALAKPEAALRTTSIQRRNVI